MVHPLTIDPNGKIIRIYMYDPYPWNIPYIPLSIKSIEHNIKHMIKIIYSKDS